ncbi:helix-turn-helix domain-containing protein [Verrucomicrobiota bacterium]
MKTDLEELLGQSLRIELGEAGVTLLPGKHTTHWRVLPYFMFSQVWKGSERMWLSDDRWIDAKKGQLIVLPAGITHKVDVTSREEPRHWAHVNYFVMHGVELFSIIECPNLIEPRIGTDVGEAILDWAGKVHQPGRRALERITAKHELGMRLLALIVPVCRLRSGAVERFERAKRLDGVIQYMHGNFERALKRDELARVACLSPAQFHVVFRELIGKTPGEYLCELRLRHAQQLLITTALQVKEIACRCGYEDPFVFCRFFRRSCGHTPTDYRRLVRL